MCVCVCVCDFSRFFIDPKRQKSNFFKMNGSTNRFISF